MRKETDLPKVKMIAHVLLDMPIAETSFSPAIVSHPFTSTGVTAAQNEDGNITVVDLLNNKEDYAKWKEMVGKQIDSAKNACQVFFLLNKPYYLTFLKFSAPVLSQEDLGQLLAHAWILEECPMKDQKFPLRPASREEAGLFYSNDERDEVLGTVGHLRMDFGSGGKGFHHTWWPHNEDRFNTPEFKEALQEFVDAMRQSGPLKNLAAMNTYCWHNGGEISENDRVYGFVAETERYRFCLRCTPRPGDYQGYLYCYDLRQQEMARQEKLVGRVTYASGEQQEFCDPQRYLQTIREELPYRNTTGFRYETLTDDPAVKKAVDDILLDVAGEENPRRTCNYGLTEAGKQALRDAADPSKPHTYSWFVMTDCNTSKEQSHRALTLDGAIQLYQDSDRPEKRLGVTKDSIATVDLVRFCDGEQQFFEDYRRLESFRDDPAISDAAETIRQELKQTAPQEDITMGGM